MNHSNISLENIIKKLNNNQYIIPFFKGRRTFIWGTKAIESLGDSIIRGIPISPLVSANINNSSHYPIQLKLVVEDNIPSNNETENTLMIDGYQRIAAISKIFFNSKNNKSVYQFDLLSILMEKYLIYKEKTGLFADYLNSQEKDFEISDCFCKLSPKSDSIEPNTRFLPASEAVEGNYNRYINSFLSEIKECNISTDEELNEYLDYLTSTFSSLNDYRFIGTVIESNPKLTTVSGIYGKLNHLAS